MTSYIDRVESLFLEYQNPTDAMKMKAYMRDKFDFLGIKAPLRRTLSRPFLAKDKRPSFNVLQSVILESWGKHYREFQYFGIDLLNKYDKAFSVADLSFIEKLICQKSWWDTVDALQTVVGNIVQRDPSGFMVMERWNNSDNIWLIRMSILFQLKYKDKVDTDFLAKMILNQHMHSDFFVQKGIGWALRQYGKYNAVWVKYFINTNTLSGLAKREAIKHF